MKDFHDFVMVSISSMFYKQLFLKKIPKVQKDTDDLTVLIALLESSCVKASCNYVGEIDT